MQRELDFDWALVDRVDEALPEGTGVAVEVLRHVWCLVARLHRTDAGRAAAERRPVRGCYAAAAFLADIVREKLKAKRKLIDSVERALAWLSREGLLFVRVAPAESGRGSERRRYVDFAGAREWLDRVHREEIHHGGTENTEQAGESVGTEANEGNEGAAEGGTNSASWAGPTPLLGRDQLRFLPATNSASCPRPTPLLERPYKEDLRDLEPPPTDSGRTVEGAGDRESLKTPISADWLPVLAILAEHGATRPKPIVRRLIERGVPPELAGDHLRFLTRSAVRDPPRAAMLIGALDDIEPADVDRWRTHHSHSPRNP